MKVIERVKTLTARVNHYKRMNYKMEERNIKGALDSHWIIVNSLVHDFFFSTSIDLHVLISFFFYMTLSHDFVLQSEIEHKDEF